MAPLPHTQVTATQPQEAWSDPAVVDPVRAPIRSPAPLVEDGPTVRDKTTDAGGSCDVGFAPATHLRHSRVLAARLASQSTKFVAQPPKGTRAKVKHKAKGRRGTGTQQRKSLSVRTNLGDGSGDLNIEQWRPRDVVTSEQPYGIHIDLHSSIVPDYGRTLGCVPPCSILSNLVTELPGPAVEQKQVVEVEVEVAQEYVEVSESRVSSFVACSGALRETKDIGTEDESSATQLKSLPSLTESAVLERSDFTPDDTSPAPQNATSPGAVQPQVDTGTPAIESIAQERSTCSVVASLGTFGTSLHLMQPQIDNVATSFTVLNSGCDQSLICPEVLSDNLSSSLYEKGGNEESHVFETGDAVVHETKLSDCNSSPSPLSEGEGPEVNPIPRLSETAPLGSPSRQEARPPRSGLFRTVSTSTSLALDRWIAKIKFSTAAAAQKKKEGLNVPQRIKAKFKKLSFVKSQGPPVDLVLHCRADAAPPLLVAEITAQTNSPRLPMTPGAADVCETGYAFAPYADEVRRGEIRETQVVGCERKKLFSRIGSKIGRKVKSADTGKLKRPWTGLTKELRAQAILEDNISKGRLQ